MRKLLMNALWAMIIVIPFSTRAQQAPSGKLLIQTTFIVDWPEKGSMMQLDSLLTIYKKMYTRLPMVSNFTIAHHEWGSDSRQVVLFYEVKNLSDLDATDAAFDKIVEETYPDKEARKKYWHALGGYFHGKHSDEIYKLLD